MIVERIEAPESFDGSEGLLAIVLRGRLEFNGTQFVSDKKDPLQVGVVQRDTGNEIGPHKHNSRDYVTGCKSYGEVLFIRTGAVEVTYYLLSSRRACRKVMLYTGDVLIHYSGAHSFKFLQYTEMLEVKPGPYSNSSQDKVPFHVERD